MANTDEIDLVKYGVLWAKVEGMDKRIEKIEGQVEKIGDQITELVALANKSRGGLWVAMAIVGGLTTIAVTLLNFLRGH